MENQKLFNIWKNQVEDIEIKTQLDCLRIIELNLSNICNLRCPFCPQSKNWKIKEPRYMSKETAREVARQLKSFNFQGYICTAGFGEPTLNPDFEEIIEYFKGFNIVLVSNGIPRESELWEKISSYVQIKISVHHWKDIDWYKDKFKNTNAWFRNHDMINPEMNIYNRSGAMGNTSKPLNTVCNLPYYKVFIDTDGSYLRCEADWSRKSESDYNIFNKSIDSYFVEILEKDRLLMLQPGYRQNFDSCKYCDINGTLTGKKFLDYWKENHDLG